MFMLKLVYRGQSSVCLALGSNDHVGKSLIMVRSYRGNHYVFNRELVSTDCMYEFITSMVGGRGSM